MPNFYRAITSVPPTDKEANQDGVMKHFFDSHDVKPFTTSSRKLIAPTLKHEFPTSFQRSIKWEEDYSMPDGYESEVDDYVASDADSELEEETTQPALTVDPSHETSAQQIASAITSELEALTARKTRAQDKLKRADLRVDSVDSHIQRCIDQKRRKESRRPKLLQAFSEAESRKKRNWSLIKKLERKIGLLDEERENRENFRANAQVEVEKFADDIEDAQTRLKQAQREVGLEAEFADPQIRALAKKYRWGSGIKDEGEERLAAVMNADVVELDFADIENLMEHLGSTDPVKVEDNAPVLPQVKIKVEDESGISVKREGNDDRVDRQKPSNLSPKSTSTTLQDDSSDSDDVQEITAAKMIKKMKVIARNKKWLEKCAAVIAGTKRVHDASSDPLTNTTTHRPALSKSESASPVLKKRKLSPVLQNRQMDSCSSRSTSESDYPTLAPFPILESESDSDVPLVRVCDRR